jgi:hypothetical protein
MFCDKCGTKNPDDSRFCSRCGKPLLQQSVSQPSVNMSKSSKLPIERNYTKPASTISAIIMSLKGQNGQIDLYQDKIIIKRSGFFAVLNHGFTKGDKTIFISQITGIQLKLAGLMVGYIQFTVPGGIESKQGIWSAKDDENSVTFYLAENDSATQLKEKIEELLHKSRQGTNQTIQVSSADEIKKFKQLLDDGIITNEEFNKKKKELLGL